MKTGEAAKILGVDAKTVRAWLEHPELQKFFSPGASGERDFPHRVLTESDLLTLNTIREYRAGARISDWDELAKLLDSGYRASDFPSHNAISGDPRTIPMQQAEQSVRAAATMEQRDAALSRIQALETTINKLEQALSEERDRSRETEGKLLREIGDLQRELGKAQAELDLWRSGRLKPEDD